MRSLTLGLVLLLARVALAENKDAGKALHEFFEAEWNYDMEQSPARASSMGDRRWNDRWGDQSLEAIHKREAHAKDALERLAEAQKELREALERSRELFRRAAVEGDLANLGKESRDLLQEQRKWNSGIATADSSRAAGAERGLGQRADSLGAALDRLAKSMEPGGRQDRLVRSLLGRHGGG